MRSIQAVVQGRPAVYRPVGEGPPLVFLHGWSLDGWPVGTHSYRRCLAAPAAHGSQVLTPALPGFGAADELPPASSDRWSQR
jgi:pimeloyl-ACP methyl ester carboxylesterase